MFVHQAACPICEVPELPQFHLPAAYVYLLGVYLGDGCVTTLKHGNATLRVYCDTAYPGIVESIAGAIEAVRGREPWLGLHGDNCRVLASYWRHWPCLFPQHGPGRKHTRPIRLAPWQRALIERDPRPMLRGLIETDGWRGLNRVFVKGRWYEYPRYQFSNRSDDIRGIFTWACDLIGVEWRPWTRWHISVARRDSVALLDEFIGPKR
jgi:hypothetical protein